MFNRRKIRLNITDNYFVHQLIEKGVYDRVGDIFNDAIRGSHRKEELKNISKWKHKKRAEIIAYSLHEYFWYLTKLELSKETIKRIQKVITGEINPYELKLEEIEKSQEPNKEPPFAVRFGLDLMGKVDYYNIDLKQRIEEWRESKKYDPDFNINIK